jgi:hypothetical protein
MNAYQNFLDFFSMYNKERLDGLSESYFTTMTHEEREMAFNYLLRLVEAGGTEESVNGLFRADSSRAAIQAKRLLEAGKLNDEAQIAAAWNLTKIESDESLLPIFIRFIAGANGRLRAKAAYYVPAKMFTNELKLSLQGMIRTETEQLARIHSVDKLLQCYGVTEESVDRNRYLKLYRGLHSDDLRIKEAAFKDLDSLFGSKDS